jgi:hypothetical protein
MGKPKVDERKVRKMLGRRGNGTVEIVRRGDHAIARVILDQIFERRRELRIVFDYQDLEHRQASPRLKPD